MAAEDFSARCTLTPSDPKGFVTATDQKCNDSEMESREQSTDSVLSNQSERKETEQSVDPPPTPPITSTAEAPEEDYFDPFAVEDNHKKYGTDSKGEAAAMSVDKELEPESHALGDEQSAEHKQSSNDRDDTQRTANDDKPTLDGDLFDDEEDDDDDDDAEEMDGLTAEDEAIRKEMEASWQNEEEKEKNQGMAALLAVIRNKHKEPAPTTAPALSAAMELKVPKLGRAISGQELVIKMDTGSKRRATADAKKKMAHFHPRNMGNRRKNMKSALREQLMRKRRPPPRDLAEHRDAAHSSDSDDAESADPQHRERRERRESTTSTKSVTVDLDDIDRDEDDDLDAVRATKKDADSAKESATATKIAESGPIDDEDSDVDAEATAAALAAAAKAADGGADGDGAGDGDDAVDEEDMARALLMAKPVAVPSAVREFMDIAADEEDDDGRVVREFEDSHEERFGIAKDLLADKGEVRLLAEHKKVYDAKRDAVHRRLMRSEDAKELELMKRAFVEGDYRALQRAKGKATGPSVMERVGAEEDGAERFTLGPTTRTDPRQSFEHYLSDNDEKNEFCVYDEHGMPRRVDAIRMRISEWNRRHSARRELAIDDGDDDGETAEEHRLRRQRVRKKEMMARAQTVDGLAAPKHLKIEGDAAAIKMLDRVRNKKRARPTKADPTDFGAFLAAKGLATKPMLHKTQSSSFLEHREKCKERVRSAESKSRSGGGGGSGKVVVFQRKRKRMDGGGGGDGNVLKRRRVAGH